MDTRVEFDHKSLSHRLIRTAAEQILTRKALIGCGTLGKALQTADHAGDTKAILLIGAMLAELLGLQVTERAAHLWALSKEQFAGSAWQPAIVRQAMYNEVTLRVQVAEMQEAVRMGRGAIGSHGVR